MKSRGQQITELRRSGAAGIHGKYSTDRYNKNRKAIELEVNMSILDIPSLDETAEPTAEDLANAEQDYWELMVDEYPDEHFYSDPVAYDPWMDRDADYDSYFDDYYDRY